ncbi:MAG: hypothetical protein EHM35_00520 [Planctomycetaceae bacterium]|nr:MAG: hypothetical protein EHM35_00520 [Planctomycetaceae bacterium]
MGKMISYPNGQRTVTECSHPQDAGFSVGTPVTTRHGCGQFAAALTKPYRNEAGVEQRLSTYRCYRCDVTYISDPT